MLAKWSWSLVFCSLGLFIHAAQADVDSAKKSGQIDQDLNQQEIPSEEFWLFMAEFSDEDELIDPEELAGLGADKNLKLATVNTQSSEQETSSADNSEESL